MISVVRDPKPSLNLPPEIAHWSLPAPHEKLVPIGAKAACQRRYVRFRLAKVAMPNNLFRKINSPADRGCEAILMPVKNGYCRGRLDGYPGNVSSFLDQR